MKVRDIIKLIEQDGWYLAYMRGSHRNFLHPTKSGKVTIPGHLSDTAAPKNKPRWRFPNETIRDFD